MSYFEDLTPYRYLGSVEDAVNVGWLSAVHPFLAGEVDQAEIAEVLRLVRDEPVHGPGAGIAVTFAGSPEGLARRDIL